MKLTVLERITLLSALPTEGNFVTLKIVRQLRESLSFNEEDIKTLEIREDAGRLVWNPQADGEGAEIQIGEKATDLIVEALKKLDEQRKLTEQHFSLYEKFIAS